MKNKLVLSQQGRGYIGGFSNCNKKELFFHVFQCGCKVWFLSLERITKKNLLFITPISVAKMEATDLQDEKNKPLSEHFPQFVLSNNSRSRSIINVSFSRHNFRFGLPSSKSAFALHIYLLIVSQER
jgi:hypothetical protein